VEKKGKNERSEGFGREKEKERQRGRENVIYKIMEKHRMKY
jgi:hypothetical protein